jgi:hypothetical protein
MDLYILSSEECRTALQYAESKDAYITQCLDSRANYIARTNTVYKPAILSDSDFTAYDQLLTEFVRHIPARLKKELDYASIAIIMPSADNGFPHTRPDKIICFPQSASMPLLQTFIHELWHLHQRRYPDLWNKLYTQSWGFSKWNGYLPDELGANIRLNPDTIQYGLFCWRKEWVPLPIFLSPTNPQMNESAIWFFNIQTRRWKHSPPEAWSDYFGSSHIPPSANEHPNELSAYMLSQITHDTRGPPAFVDLVKAVGVTSFKP